MVVTCDPMVVRRLAFVSLHFCRVSAFLLVLGVNDPGPGHSHITYAKWREGVVSTFFALDLFSSIIQAYVI